MESNSPIMKVGKYAGKRLDTLPNGYLRWLVGQDFPKEIADAAMAKLEKSEYHNEQMAVSRHALDMFSKRCLSMWLESRERNPDADGIATFVSKLAVDAWEHGEDISKHRHQDDGVTKQKDGIKWVFSVNTNSPDYREVITIMPM